MNILKLAINVPYKTVSNAFQRHSIQTHSGCTVTDVVSDSRSVEASNDSAAAE